jgi:hypothetical protein
MTHMTAVHLMVPAESRGSVATCETPLSPVPGPDPATFGRRSTTGEQPPLPVGPDLHRTTTWAAVADFHLATYLCWPRLEARMNREDPEPVVARSYAASAFG